MQLTLSVIYWSVRRDLRQIGISHSSLHLRYVLRVTVHRNSGSSLGCNITLNIFVEYREGKYRKTYRLKHWWSSQRLHHPAVNIVRSTQILLFIVSAWHTELGTFLT